MRELDSLLHSNRPLYTPICGPGILKRPSSRMLFVFRTIPLQAAFLPEVFCFLHVDPLPPQYLGLTIVRPSRSFFPGTMALADFLQFVVTTHFFRIRLPHASTRPPRVLTHSFPSIYLPHLPQAIRVALGLRLVWEPCPRLEPCTRFLFVRPEVCRQLPSDSASRQTPLP